MAMAKKATDRSNRPRSYAMGEFKDTPDGGKSGNVSKLRTWDGVDWVATYTLEQQADGAFAHKQMYACTKEPGQAV